MPSRVILFTLCFLGLTRAGYACSCRFPGPAPCRNLALTGAVFVGTVESIENPAFEDEANAAESDQDTPPSKGAYYSRYHFRQEGQYLVFPYRSDDGKYATICSETRPIELAQGKPAVLRALRDHLPVASRKSQRESTEFSFPGRQLRDAWGRLLQRNPAGSRDRHPARQRLERRRPGAGSYLSHSLRQKPRFQPRETIGPLLY